MSAVLSASQNAYPTRSRVQREPHKKMARRRSVASPLPARRPVSGKKPAPKPVLSKKAEQYLRLPKRLFRPTPREVDSSVFSSLEEGLSTVPAQYVRERLSSAGSSMLASVASTSLVGVSSTLPTEVEYELADKSLAAPTHVLAVHSSLPFSSSKKVALLPAHALVLSAHCANLPAFPISSVSAGKLPVVPLAIPFPETFPLLQSYLYTGLSEPLASSLVPLPVYDSSMPFSARIKATYTVSARLALAARIRALHANVVALGIHDDALWRVLGCTYDAVVCSLQ